MKEKYIPIRKRKDKYFLLFANCFPVRGWVDAIICDTFLYRSRPIPTWLYMIIFEAKTKKLGDVLESFTLEEQKGIINQLEMLIEEGYGFLTNEPEIFSDIDLSWDYPAIVNNSIIDISNKDNLNLNNICNLIDRIGCESAHLILPKEAEDIKRTIKDLSNTRLRSISISLNFINFNYHYNILKLIEKFIKVSYIYIYGYPTKRKDSTRFNKRIIYKSCSSTAEQFYTENKNHQNFTTSLNFFTEAQKHHTYFNRKIYISATGDIKNAPECEELIGNINDNNINELVSAIQLKANQKYWYVSKDQCDVCKHCEFRYMCMDNRIPYQRRDGGWYHKEECDYNPYISKWKGEEGYLTLKECNILSDQNWFFIDYSKLENTNNKISN